MDGGRLGYAGVRGQIAPEDGQPAQGAVGPVQRTDQLIVGQIGTAIGVHLLPDGAPGNGEGLPVEFFSQLPQHLGHPAGIVEVHRVVPVGGGVNLHQQGDGLAEPVKGVQHVLCVKAQLVG